MYGSGDTVRGDSLWFDGCLLEYTEQEYKTAKSRVERRLKLIEGVQYFPLKKDMYIKYNEKLILKTIYGKHIAETFKKNLTGFLELSKACQKESKETGTVTAIDGRKLVSRSPHSALNLLLQGSAGIIAKKWMTNYHELATQSGLPHGDKWTQSAFIHDEYQCACDTEYADALGQIMVDGCAMIQEQYNTALPIEADYIVGETWADTH
jgi:DNA polymerase I-like protein with 3'-5' exonuclease and polymerase domains